MALLRTLATRKILVGGLGLGFKRQSRGGFQTFHLPDLAYEYSALEPAISADIMHLHHQTYINYNKALEQLHDAMSKGDSSTVVKLQSAIKFNGGGDRAFGTSILGYGKIVTSKIFSNKDPMVGRPSFFPSCKGNSDQDPCSSSSHIHNVNNPST